MSMVTCGIPSFSGRPPLEEEGESSKIGIGMGMVMVKEEGSGSVSCLWTQERMVVLMRFGRSESPIV